MKEDFSFNTEPTADDRTSLEHFFEEGRKEAQKPVVGEIEKTPTELKFIDSMNSYINEEFAVLGILEKSNILPEQIHLLSKEGFKKIRPKGASAFADDQENVSYIDKDENKLALYYTILHESIHLLSFKKLYAEIKQDGDQKHITVTRTRVGHYTRNAKGNDPGHQHFRGLMEAVADKTAEEIFNKHKEEITRDFGFTLDDSTISTEEHAETKKNKITISHERRTDHVKILNTIIKRIAEKKGEDEQAVWQRFQKGQLTGEMMHLREDIERTFGAGSLRVLGALDSGTKDLKFGEAARKILEYFKTDDEKQKDEIASEVLNVREEKKYKVRRKNN